MSTIGPGPSALQTISVSRKKHCLRETGGVLSLKITRTQYFSYYSARNQFNSKRIVRRELQNMKMALSNPGRTAPDISVLIYPWSSVNKLSLIRYPTTRSKGQHLTRPRYPPHIQGTAKRLVCTQGNESNEQRKWARTYLRWRDVSEDSPRCRPGLHILNWIWPSGLELHWIKDETPGRTQTKLVYQRIRNESKKNPGSWQPPR